MSRSALRMGLLGFSRLFPVCFSLVAPLTSISVHAAVGRTPGTFAVSSTGAATYTIPIWNPPGPNGLQPNIALTYNSQAGNGLAGVGWGISGLSSVYRCSQTYAQDPVPAPVALVTSDGYCMDGQRLRRTSGTYGQAGSTYQTEVANFITVTAYGSAGNGPAYFIATDRNGVQYTYGNGGNSQILASGNTTALSWQLNQIADTAGNTLTIAYNTTTGSPPCTTTNNLPTGASVPCTISWTPSAHGANTYNYTMQFTYGPNVPQSSYYGYKARTPVTNTNLLSSISINYLGSTVKKYVLGYQTGPTTGRNRLINVQECADAGATNCISPVTTISYQDGGAGVSVSGQQAATNVLGGFYSYYDFNGDGYKDILYSNGTSWYVAFGSSSGYGTPVYTGVANNTSTYAIPGDVLGNGKAGILANSGSTWSYYTWNGSAFVGVSTGLPYDSTVHSYVLADIEGN